MTFLEGLGIVAVNTLAFVVFLAIAPSIDTDDDDDLVFSGVPSETNPLAAKTLAERQYWLGRGSSPQDTYWEYVLARNLSFEAWKREVNYIRTPAHLREKRNDVPFVTRRILDRAAKGEKLNNLRKEW